MPVDVGLINPIGLAGEALNYSKMLPDFAAQDLQRRELAMRSQQEQRLRYEQASKEQRIAQYQAELVELNQNPTTENVSRFMMKWPEFANENKAAIDVRETGRNKANLERMGNIAFALDKNRPLALKLMKENAAAEAAAGNEVDPIMARAIEDLESGDEARMNEATATAKIILARAVGGKEFLTAMGGDPTDFEKKMAAMNKIRPDDTSLGAQYARTTAAGQMGLAYEPGTENVIGAYSLGDLPRLSVGGARAAPAAATGAALQGPGIENVVKTAIPGVNVTSRARTPAQNRKAGGVADSMHLTDQARDFTPPKGMSMDELGAKVRKLFPNGDVLNEGDHIHVESRVRQAGGPMRQDSQQAATIRAQAQAAIAAGANADAVKQRARSMGVVM